MVRSPIIGPSVSAQTDSSDSDLTSVSTPIEVTEILQDIKPPLARKDVESIAPSISRLGNKSSRKSLLNLGADNWSMETLGSYVWVLIDQNARVFEPDGNDDDLSNFKDGIWWPGKLESSDTSILPLKIHLYGEIAIRGVRSAEIHRPCHMNILSLQDSRGRMRFLTPTFINEESYYQKNIHSSPRKKHKNERINMEQGWHTAVAEVEEERGGREDDGTDGSDGMPEIGSTGFSLYMDSNSTLTTPTKGTKKVWRGQKRNRGNSSGSETEYGIAESRWSPPPPDELLQIPGELVLALDTGSSKMYWPAKILAYVPPKNPKQEPKYQVKYLDETVTNVTRNMFITSYQNEFPTCMLGTWESQYKEVQNDEDDDVEPLSIFHPRTRSPSPEVVHPHPDATTFTQLSIREQFVYTKPILSSVLNEKYPPARARHDDFIAGGSRRKKVVDEAGLRGGMDPREVTTLQHLLSYWCLRNEIRAEVITDGEGGDEHTMDQLSEGSENCFLETVPSETTLENVGSSTSNPEATPPLSQTETPPSSSRSASQSFISTLGALDSMNSTSSKNPCEPSSRQRGCHGYENLSRVEKADYCLNVLLPEAILQILLWRTGKRCSNEIFSDTEEETLHRQGQQLLRERDWVYDVLRLREAGRRRLKLSGSTSDKNADDEVLYSITGRPKRSVAAPRSYLE